MYLAAIMEEPGAASAEVKILNRLHIYAMIAGITVHTIKINEKQLAILKF
jgi:hypothetical protein